MQVILPFSLSKMGLPQARGFVNAADAICNDYLASDELVVIVNRFHTCCVAMNDLYSNVEIQRCADALKKADEERIAPIVSARKHFDALRRNETYVYHEIAQKAYDALKSTVKVQAMKRQDLSAFIIGALDVLSKLDNKFVTSSEYAMSVTPLTDKQKAYSVAETALATARGNVSQGAKKKALRLCLNEFRLLYVSIVALFEQNGSADASELIEKLEGLMATESTTIKKHDAAVAYNREVKLEQQRLEAERAEEVRKQEEAKAKREEILRDKELTEEAYNYLKQNHPEMIK